jgi:tRNA-specific 2-thiouridylase
MRRSPCVLARVVVGMSGGVDSAVTAMLLKRQGHSVHGLFVRSWDSRDETGACPAEEDWKHVQRVCDTIGMDCTRRSFVNEYWMDVFEPMLAEYQRGRTPNPDTDCNRHIKFRAMVGCALDGLGADLFATGHYAQLHEDATGVHLLRSPDRFATPHTP